MQFEALPLKKRERRGKGEGEKKVDVYAYLMKQQTRSIPEDEPMRMGANRHSDINRMVSYKTSNTPALCDFRKNINASSISSSLDEEANHSGMLSYFGFEHSTGTCIMRTIPSVATETGLESEGEREVNLAEEEIDR
ncbi:hypothetical protein LOAG_08722 [Loa loa]|uniref:Uncharacterized protein n=1 Tax=Loa loa TaxID=7209 RepID=A0A1S0TTP5_LOALO|nr:hypothetical protein LOAG_08722 [Loa loa]EFO19773.1 hypothetical protein LOAG_08722 [Loa loa]